MKPHVIEKWYKNWFETFLKVSKEQLEDWVILGLKDNDRVGSKPFLIIWSQIGRHYYRLMTASDYWNSIQCGEIQPTKSEVTEFCFNISINDPFNPNRKK